MQLREVKEKLKNSKVIEKRVIQSDDGKWCAVKLTIEYQKEDKEYYTGVGFSKYNAKDSQCPDTPVNKMRGLQIAEGRAIHEIAKRVQEKLITADLGESINGLMKFLTANPIMKKE